MIKYVLNSELARESVDLRNYSQDIFAIVCGIIRDREVDFEDSKDFFVLHASPSVTEEEFAQINQKLVSSELGSYELEGQPLFTAVECEEQDLALDTAREDKYTRFLREMKARKQEKAKNR